jgi:hypothetical protein
LKVLILEKNYGNSTKFVPRRLVIPDDIRSSESGSYSLHSVLISVNSLIASTVIGVTVTPENPVPSLSSQNSNVSFLNQNALAIKLI